MNRIGPAIFTAAILLMAACPAHSAETKQKKLSGSGPIDRPTAHSNGWTFRDWSIALCSDAPRDSFVADGDSARVRWTVRNRRTGQPAAKFALDNVVVLERSVYEANLVALGPSLVLWYSSVVDPGTVALDFDPLLPGGVVYHTDFDGAIGPEWSCDAQQVFWESAYEHPDPLVTGVMFDDPFDPQFIDGEPYSPTGEMRIGTGVGPEFLTVDLQLSGLTRGTEYVVSYWSRSIYVGTTDPCTAPNAEWEVEVFGEELECFPDPAGFSVVGARTLDWNPSTRIWRLQLEVGNDDLNGVIAGAATATGLDLASLSTDVTVNVGEVVLPDLQPGQTGWSGPIELQFSSRVPDAVLPIVATFDYVDDCGERALATAEAFIDGPTVAPTSAPLLADRLSVRTEPNPFNPRTSVMVRGAPGALVSVDVHDLHGRRVRTLWKGLLAASTQRIDWDGTDDDGDSLASGVYLIVVRGGGAVARHKIALVR